MTALVLTRRIAMRFLVLGLLSSARAVIQLDLALIVPITSASDLGTSFKQISCGALAAVAHINNADASVVRNLPALTDGVRVNATLFDSQMSQPTGYLSQDHILHADNQCWESAVDHPSVLLILESTRLASLAIVPCGAGATSCVGAPPLT